jgi:PAS domain S-box-containing protein
MERKFEILVVDDDVALASNLHDILEGEGYNTTVADDGRTALTLCREKVFDLALVDIKLPEMTGVELIDKLIQLSLETSYIIITGHASLESAIEAVKQKSIIAYETKPLNMEHLLSLIRQIVARKLAEEALQESEERYRAIFEQAADSIVLIDVETGVLVNFNEQAYKNLGYTLEEFQKLKIPDFEVTQSAEEVAKHIEKIIKEGSDNFEAKHRTKSGEVRDIQVSARAISIRGRNFVQSIWRDITDRKRAEEERRELEQRAQLTSRLASVGEMASGIAHEINNPLTCVIGYAQLLMQTDTSKDIKKDIEVIYDGAQRVAGIVKRLLTFARQYKPEQAYVDINEIIEATLDLRAYHLKTSNIKVTTKLAPDLPITIADAGQLQQVFLNLIVNAETEMKLAHGKGELLIKTEQIDNTIQISFKDDGPGIPKGNLKRIFDPFFTTREVGQGTGLGLSVCHGIITEHNGGIRAESKLGKGATFIVELPVVTEAKRLELAEPDIDELKEVSKAKILVVDDEPVILQFLSRVLSDEGHEIETVDNADDALEMVKSKRYSLILLDIKMPGMSGIEFYKHMQKMTPSLAKRVMFVTGDVMEARTTAFLSKTKAPHFTKPFDAEQLKKKVKRILN